MAGLGPIDSLKTDAVGDPMPTRAILPQSPLSYRKVVERALAASGANGTKCGRPRGN